MDWSEGRCGPREGNESDIWGGTFAEDAWYAFLLVLLLVWPTLICVVSLPNMIASSSLDAESVQLVRDYVSELLL